MFLWTRQPRTPVTDHAGRWRIHWAGSERLPEKLCFRRNLNNKEPAGERKVQGAAGRGVRRSEWG